MDVTAHPSATELDLATAPALARALADYAASDDVLLDLSRVTFCDARGVRVLWDDLDRHAAAGGSLRLRGARPNVHDVFALVGMTDVTKLDGLR